MQIENAFHYPLTVTILDPIPVFQNDVRVGPRQILERPELGDGRVTFGPAAHVVDPEGKESCLVVFDEQAGAGVIASSYRSRDSRVAAWRNDEFFM
jgi:hypothetical protein